MTHAAQLVHSSSSSCDHNIASALCIWLSIIYYLFIYIFFFIFISSFSVFLIILLINFTLLAASVTLSCYFLSICVFYGSLSHNHFVLMIRWLVEGFAFASALRQRIVTNGGDRWYMWCVRLARSSELPAGVFSVAPAAQSNAFCVGRAGAGGRQIYQL